MIIESDWPIDVELSLNSGQLFHWRRFDSPSQSSRHSVPKSLVLHRHTALVLKQLSPTQIMVKTRGRRISRHKLKNILGLDINQKEIHEAIRQDKAISHLGRRYSGLTILGQDPYECLVSFLSSTMSNIPRIMKNLGDLRREMGSPIDGTPFHSFPTAGVIADAGERKLRELGFGYRSKFIVETCQILQTVGRGISAWGRYSTEDLKQRLLSLPGVGQKVAECVLLYAFRRITAFPIDIWVRRALMTLWPDRSRWSDRKWSMWARDRWGDSAGYVQQILFCGARSGNLVRSKQA